MEDLAGKWTKYRESRAHTHFSKILISGFEKGVLKFTFLVENNVLKSISRCCVTFVPPSQQIDHLGLLVRLLIQQSPLYSSFSSSRVKAETCVSYNDSVLIIIEFTTDRTLSHIRYVIVLLCEEVSFIFTRLILCSPKRLYSTNTFPSFGIFLLGIETI
jgi:hypothetical protein